MVSGSSPAGGLVAYKPIFPGCLIERKFVNNRIQSVVEDKLDVVWYGRWARMAPGRDTEYVQVCHPPQLASSCFGPANAERSREYIFLAGGSGTELFLPLSAWETRCCGCSVCGCFLRLFFGDRGSGRKMLPNSLS